MSAKPTPGPYRVRKVDNRYGYCVETLSPGKQDNRVIATFWAGPSHAKAMANARAWVEGREAMEALKRIRGILERPPLGETMRDLRKELLSALEVKP